MKKYANKVCKTFLKKQVYVAFLSQSNKKQISLQLMHFEQEEESKRKYSRISLKKRQTLVNLIIGEEFTIARAAKRLGIKASTARMILNKYKSTGTFPSKIFKNTPRPDPGESEEARHSLKEEQPVSEAPYRVVSEEDPSAHLGVSPVEQTQNRAFGVYPQMFFPSWPSQMGLFTYSPCFYQ